MNRRETEAEKPSTADSAGNKSPKTLFMKGK